MNNFFQPMNYRLAYCRECHGSFNINARPDGFCSDECGKKFKLKLDFMIKNRFKEP
jgi:hypothetical protein